MDNRLISGIVFIDLKKAFDTLHEPYYHASKAEKSGDKEYTSGVV